MEGLVKRKPTRLAYYDYSQSGAYFVTICTDNRKCILSDIAVGDGFPVPKLTVSGKIVEGLIGRIKEKYPMMAVDKYVIMPNHIHLIIFISNQNGTGNPSPTISDAMAWLKYLSTKQINEKSGTAGKRVFQRSFHDHVIRCEDDYRRIWEYIDTNPAKWADDPLYIDERTYTA